MAMDMPLRTVKTNIVQSIRAFRVADLQSAAAQLGYHFLYANLANAQSKQDILDMTTQQFTFAPQAGKNFDALFDSMSDALYKSGQQPGFILVLEHIPAHAKFDKEAREQLLDAVWGRDIHVEPRTVDVHIRRLRKAINQDQEVDLIRTVRSAGYSLDQDAV